MFKTRIALLLVVCLAASLCQFEAAATPKATFITVTAGSADRRETVVSFALPKALQAKAYRLFVLTELQAGTTRKYKLEAAQAEVAAADGVQAVQTREQLTLKVAGRPAFVYQAQPGQLPSKEIKEIFRRGGYLHPVYTPQGRVITDDYPPDHYHHHGIWFAWTKTEFEGRHPDFWNMGDGTGTVEFVALDGSWSGPVQGGFRSRHRYVDLSGAKPTTVLNEEWKVIAYNVGRGPRAYSMFDLIATHECATSSPLVLPEYRYGGVGFRGHRQWLAKDNCVFLTSEGKDRNNGHGTRARWCHIGGRIDGQPAGLAVLDHPSNFRAPQAMRINPDQPFFCYSPSLLGGWEITPGKPYVSRYRFIVYDGEPDTAELDRLWNDYATPPLVAVTLE
jgi:hypothetical protein